MLETLYGSIPSVATTVAVVCVLWAANLLLEKHSKKYMGNRFRNQILMVALTFAGLLIIIMVVPLGESRRGQLLSFIGILMSAAIALSSTTVLGNGMAGLMLRAVGGFRTGDFIHCGDHFGRVTERGLVHTEIQNEDRRLTTLPNLYLVTHPLTKIRNSGTIIATELSLGYDVSRTRIEPLLIEAAGACELTAPFVQIKALGDFSVTYRIAGMLAEVKNMITMESLLRAAVLDGLHGAGIEIVSPNYMNQRQLAADEKHIPTTSPRAAPQALSRQTLENVVFDKAEEAETIEALRQRRAEVVKEIDELTAVLKKCPEDERKEKTTELERLESRAATLKRVIELRESRSAKD